MSTLTYHFDGRKFNLSDEDRQPFDNTDKWNCVDVHAATVFNLKDGNQLIGEVLDINYIYPVGGYDDPLQAQFSVETEEGKTITLKFYEIESHHPAPFISKQIFK